MDSVLLDVLKVTADIKPSNLTTDGSSAQFPDGPTLLPKINAGIIGEDIE